MKHLRPLNAVSEAATIAWLERCLMVIEIDPETAQPAIGILLRRHVIEDHRLVCGNCRDDWRKVDSETSWYGVCAGCGSDQLVVESTPVPGIGSDEWELECNTCAATWTGYIGEPCEWCERAQRSQLDHQGELLLKVPEYDRDANYEARCKAWLQRLHRGVTAELITQTQAETAVKRLDRRR